MPVSLVIRSPVMTAHSNFVVLLIKGKIIIKESKNGASVLHQLCKSYGSCETGDSRLSISLYYSTLPYSKFRVTCNDNYDYNSRLEATVADPNTPMTTDISCSVCFRPPLYFDCKYRASRYIRFRYRTPHDRSIDSIPRSTSWDFPYTRIRFLANRTCKSKPGRA